MMNAETVRLASIAHLARILDVSPDRVAKAIAHLEARGLVEFQPVDRTR